MSTQPDQNQPTPEPIDYHGRDKADPSTWGDVTPAEQVQEQQEKAQQAPTKKAAASKKSDE